MCQFCNSEDCNKYLDPIEKDDWGPGFLLIGRKTVLSTYPCDDTVKSNKNINAKIDCAEGCSYFHFNFCPVCGSELKDD